MARTNDVVDVDPRDLLEMALAEIRSRRDAAAFVSEVVSKGEADDIGRRLHVAIVLLEHIDSKEQHRRRLRKTQKEIAASLGYSQKTVGDVYERVFGKDSSGVVNRIVAKLLASQGRGETR